MNQAIPIVGLCKDCNYPLHDLPSGRCPECGREFDPNKPTTMNMGRPIGPVIRWILRPAGRGLVVVVVIPTLLLLWMYRLPDPYYLLHVLGPLLFCSLLFIVAVASEGIRSGIAEWYGQPYVSNLRTRTAKRLGIFVAASMLGIVLQIPMRVAFVLSMPAMERFRHELAENPTVRRPPTRWVGLYNMSTSLRIRSDGVMQMHLAGSVEAGFGYSLPPVSYAGSNAGAGGRLWGPWYWFSDD